MFSFGKLSKNIKLSSMSRKPVDINEKVKELRSILIKYNGLPSQAVDRIAYANIKYYIKKYGDDTRVQSLVDEFNINIGNKSCSDFNNKYEEIKETLKVQGRIPSCNEDRPLYDKVQYFFKKYADNPDVEELKYIYAHNSCYPLPESKRNKPNFNPFTIYIAQSDYSKWQFNASFEYIIFVYARYSVLPAPNTKPMLDFERAIDKWCRFHDKRKDDFKKVISFLVEHGCKDERIIKIKNSFSFDKEEVQERINNLLIQHGACTISYIAHTAIPGHPVPEKFVYYYYYTCFNDNRKFRGTSPLGELYNIENDAVPLYVHYRNLNQCNIDEIRMRVMNLHRNWEEDPPLLLEEMEAYGEYCFFIPCKNSEWYRKEYLSFDKSFPQNCIEAGHPYFRYYKVNAELKYLDYKLFLLENGFELRILDDKWHFDIMSVQSLANNSLLHLWTDIIAAYKIAKLSKDCLVDDYGGIYLQTEKDLILLFLPLNAVYYKVNRRTSLLSRNSFLTCKESLRIISFGANIKSLAGADLNGCNRLEQVVIPPFKLEDYCKLFSKKSTSFFCDGNYEKIDTHALYKGTILEWVPYVESFDIPDGVTNISEDAFAGCELKNISIPGTIKEINSPLLRHCTTLKNASIGEGVKKLWGGVFEGCENLEKVNLPDSLEVIYGTFNECKSLTEIHLKKKLSYIGYNSFRNCSSLVSITIDGHITTLGDHAFEGCCSLKSIAFNHGIHELHRAFDDCTNLESIYFRGDYEYLDFGISYQFQNCQNLKAIYVPSKYYALFLSKIDKKHAGLIIIED